MYICHGNNEQTHTGRYVEVDVDIESRSQGLVYSARWQGWGQ